MKRWREWQERREEAKWDRFREEHRWDRLSHYNAEKGRGIVHTAEWDRLMADEQAAFNRENHQQGNSTFPVTIEPGETLILTVPGEEE